MFTPPFKGADGKPLYPEMTKDAVLYGGTDPGRFCPTYMIFCESFTPHHCQPMQDQNFDRRDVYIITQNALADGTYLCYIRAQYNRSKQIDPPFFQRTGPHGPQGQGLRDQSAGPRWCRRSTFFTALGARIEKRRRTYTSWFADKDFTDLPGLRRQAAARRRNRIRSRNTSTRTSARKPSNCSRSQGDDRQLAPRPGRGPEPPAGTRTRS